MTDRFVLPLVGVTEAHPLVPLNCNEAVKFRAAPLTGATLTVNAAGSVALPCV